MTLECTLDDPVTFWVGQMRDNLSLWVSELAHPKTLALLTALSIAANKQDELICYRNTDLLVAQEAPRLCAYVETTLKQAQEEASSSSSSSSSHPLSPSSLFTIDQLAAYDIAVFEQCSASYPALGYLSQLDTASLSSVQNNMLRYLCFAGALAGAYVAYAMTDEIPSVVRGLTMFVSAVASLFACHVSAESFLEQPLLRRHLLRTRNEQYTEKTHHLLRYPTHLAREEYLLRSNAKIPLENQNI